MTTAERLRAYRELQNPAAGVLSRIQMLKGDKGEDGKDGKTVVGPMGPAGKDGYIPVKGVDYFDGKDGARGPRGRDGESIQGPAGKDGKDGLSPSMESILAELKKLPIAYKDIKDAPDLTDLPKLIEFLKRGGFRGGGDTVAAGTGVTISVSNGIKTINASGGSGTFFSDTITGGTIDGVNRVFTVSNTITTALALWLANSIYQPGLDFTVTGAKQITYTIAPDASLAGQPHWLSHT